MNRNLTESKPLGPVASAPRSVALLAALTLAIVVAGPQLVTAARAVVNLPTSAAAVAWGRAHGGTCDIHDDLMVACGSMRSGYAEGGTTVGNAWLYGEFGESGRHRHESRHADQWAMLGPSFPVLYGAESIRTEGDLNRNLFERWAGLHDGGYLP